MGTHTYQRIHHSPKRCLFALVVLCEELNNIWLSAFRRPGQRGIVCLGSLEERGEGGDDFGASPGIGELKCRILRQRPC